MKAKTTKFFAMLAVLAVAFAGVAVLVQEQTADAAAGEAVTKATYDEAYTAKVFTSIKLETTDNAKSVVLYKYAVKDADGKEITPATTMKAGYAYFFAESSKDKVKLPPALTAGTPLMLFVLDGVVVKLDTSAMADADLALIQLVAVSDYDATTGVITLAEQKYADDKKNTLFDANGYAYNTNPPMRVGVDMVYDAADRMFEIAKSDSGVNIIADIDEEKNFVFANTGLINAYSDITLTGDFTTVNMMAEKGMILTLVDFSGKIVYDANEFEVKNFTGTVESIESMKVLDKDGKKVLKITDFESGVVKKTSQNGLFLLDDNVSVVFDEEAVIGGAFGYLDEYGDMHALNGSQPITVGMGGFTIYSGENMIGMNGAVRFSTTQDLVFYGNVTISDTIIYAGANNGVSFQNTQADIKIAGLQIVGTGDVTLKSPVLVTSDKTFYVEGNLVLNANLKVAEGAVVKTEGVLDVSAENKPQVWNAGQVIADPTSYVLASDPQMIRVYMNSVEGTGTFYAGSAEYNGSPDDVTGVITPLPVAYGAYLDMTGICSVNLTSNNITVKNVLYKYNTMILATKNTTIPLTVSYGNEYPAEITLSGKNCSSAETGPKSATFKNVVWETASNAKITIVAPEVYQVILAKTLATDENDETVLKEPAEADEVWTSKISVVDPTGRIIPISQEVKVEDEVTDKGGVVELVFGVEYKIIGGTTTSNYNFIDPNKAFEDLTKDSQIEGSFTMIRNLETKINGQNQTEEVPVVLQITEGKRDTITVKLNDDTSKIAVGDVIMYYTEDGGETVKEVVKPASGDIKFSVFNNSDVFIKFPSIEYYRFIAAPTGLPTEAYLDVAPVTEEDEMDDWKYKLVDFVKTITTTDPPTTEPATTGKLTVTCELATVVEEFELDYNAAPGKTATITVTFSKWFEGSTVHGAEKTIELTKDDTAKKMTGTLVMFEGEIYSVSCNDVEDTWETLSYQVYEYDADDEEYVLGKSVDYTMGTPATVAANGERGDADNLIVIDRKYTVVLDTIEYAKVHNATDKDFNVVSSGITTAVAKATTEDKGAVVTSKTVDNNTTYSADITLEVKGKTVMSWIYAVYRIADNGEETEIIRPTGVGGPSTTISALDGNNESINLEGLTIRIYSMTATPIPFIVKTQPVEHAQIGDYSRVGNYGDNMFVYVSADDTSFSVKDVRVYYENPDKEGFPDYDRGYWLADPSADGKYWTYTMPAENVVLMPKVTKDYYEVTVVDQAGVQVGDKIPVAPETPAKITLPSKPLMYITEAVPTPAIADFRFVSETAEATFTMPNEDVTITATYAESEYSKDVSVTIGQKGQAINVVLYALDGAEIGAGTITIEVWYTYIDEEGDIMTVSEKVPLTYDVENKTAYVISDTTFIQKLGDNYGGAFAVTGTYTLGAAQGDIIRTAYTPVEA